MSKYGREYKEPTKFDIGDLVIETEYLDRVERNKIGIEDILANIFLIQRVQKGKNVKYYYTIRHYEHPLGYYSTVPWFSSISNYKEDKWELASTRLADKYPEYFV